MSEPKGRGGAWTDERGTSEEGRRRLESGPEASGKYGLSIASHSGLPPAGIGALAGAAERAGFSAVFVAEGHGDALSLCHPVAAATRRVRVGTAIANAALRPPVLAAKTAAQLDQAAGGRFVLGLGVANSVMNARSGIAPFAPLPMIEEYVGVVRAVLAARPPGMTAGCSAPAWCRSTARRCVRTCRSTWPRSGRGCSSWPAGSPTA